MLYKTLFVLTIIAIFAAMLFNPGGPPQIQQIQTPIFINPFSTIGTSPNIILDGSQVYGARTNVSTRSISSINGCTDFSYWNCVNEGSSDGNNSYIFISGTNPLTGYAPFGLAHNDWANYKNNTIDIWCRWNPASVSSTFPHRWAEVIFSMDDGTNHNLILQRDTYFTCPVSTTFGHVNMTGNMTPNVPANSNIKVYMIVNPLDLDVGAELDISTIKITGSFQSSGGCNGSDFWANTACQLFSMPIIGPIVQFFVLLYDVFAYIAGWVLFGAVYLGNFIAIIGWLYNIPGLPTVIQIFVSGIMTLWVGVVGFEIYKKIDPFGG